MATITSAGTGNSNATATWVGGVVPDADDDVVIDSGHTVTQNDNHTFNSLAVNGTFEASSSYSLTIDGERSNNRALDIVGTFTHGNGTITITTAADTDLRWPSSSEAYNITINHASCIARPTGNKPVIANNLTITAGTFNTLDSGGSTSHDLTVTGGIRCIGGTFTGNASTVAIGFLEINAGGTFNAPNASGSLTINNKDTTTDNRAFDNDATFNHNSGTVTITTASSTGLDLTGTGGTGINNLVINHSSCTGNFEGAVSLAGDLTITAGTFKANTPASDTLTVAGDVSVTGTLGNANLAHDQNYSFASLTIESGGTYNATSGTTTFATADTHRAGYGGQPSALEVKSGGTFTHNKGTVKLTSVYDQDIEMDGTGTLYNLTFNKSDNDVIHSSSLVIENNLDVTLAAGHSLRPSSGSNTVTVYGNTYLTTGNIGDTTQYTGTNNWGLVTINSGEFILSTGTNNVSGIRNVGGTVSQS